MKSSWKLVFIVCLMSRGAMARIDFANATENAERLPRFWTNTGFAPPEPIEKVADYFDCDDVNVNLEIIGSLPNRGLNNVRIHWLLNLLSISDYASTPLPVFDFTRLDNFLWKLINDYRLTPTVEFMTTLRFKTLNAAVWEDFAFQLISRYIGRYGVKAVAKWKFEAWNEPDLKGYNVLNFTLQGYKEYLRGIRDGMKAAERQFSINDVIKLRGPAGLFKDEEKHPLCWSVLESCNTSPDKCPIDIITFHKKGEGNEAAEILNGSLDLLKVFAEKFPNLTSLKYSNSEADPIKKWSEPRDFQADSRYAAILVETVLGHWQAKLDGRMEHLESISHDNSFLNFHPSFFTQRTLLARFQMNNTTPKHIQFVQKPVFSALGLLSNLANFAGKVNVIADKQMSYVITTNGEPGRFYACILLWSHVNLNAYSNKSRTFEIEVDNVRSNDTSDELLYFVEGIDNKRTNPWAVHQLHGSPDFPDYNVLEKMRAVQNPIILSQPAKVHDGKIILNLTLMPPFVIAIRVCSKNVKELKKPRNLRLRRVNSEEILIFWSDSLYREKCINTYEIFFKYSDNSYQQLETRPIPFMHYQLKHTIPGCFKIRSRDIFGRVSKFSKRLCYDGAKKSLSERVSDA